MNKNRSKLNKKGIELSLETIVIFIVLVIVLIVISYFFVDNYSSNSDSLNSIGNSILNKYKN